MRRGRLLEGEDGATLAQCEVYPGEEIRVVDTQQYDAADYASVVALYGGDAAGVKGRGAAAARQAERGFRGTALHGLHALEGGEGGSGGEEGEEGAAGEGAALGE